MRLAEYCVHLGALMLEILNQCLALSFGRLVDVQYAV